MFKLSHNKKIIKFILTKIDIFLAMLWIILVLLLLSKLYSPLKE